MNHPDERDLVMHLLGDREDREALRSHLSDCAECCGRVADIEALLAATDQLQVPVPDPEFETRMWQRLRPQLHEAASRDRPPEATATVIPFWNLRRVAGLGTIAAMLVVAFLLGLYNAPPGTTIVPEGTPGGGNKILFVAVGDHLESARMVLVELVNAEGTERVDISSQQVRAQGLLADNRLYRQTAQLTGQTEVLEVLDDLERVLLEIARSPGEVPVDELDWIRERIARRDLLFKVSVIEGQTRRVAETRNAEGDEL